MTELTDSHIIEATSAARALRSQLGETPDRPLRGDVLDLVERGLRIPVYMSIFPDGFAGAYLKRRGQHFIFVQADDYPTRQRFTLCHELGHHALQHNSGRLDSNHDVFENPTDPLEQQANYFASEFLMPLEAARVWLAENSRESELTLDQTIVAADAFHVSPPAMLYRFSKGDFGIERNNLDALWQRIKAHDHVARAEELGIGPGDDQIARIVAGQDWPRLPAAVNGDLSAGSLGGFDVEGADKADRLQ